MTREDARNKLANTWCFRESKGAILLREVHLIEAVRAHEAAHHATSPNYKQLNQPSNTL